MSNQAFDASIPVLTEVFDKEEAPAAAALPAQGTLHADLEQRAIDTWTEPEWTLLERRLSERILQQLQGRVDFVLEQRLKDSMEEVLRHAVAGLTAEIQQGLQQTIEKIVVRAVAQELTHLQTLKK
ncbi:hypothetical protein [Massilia soli]|uniref:DUF2486 family protein n=1 Tax=Massilia soli TaxID=2792854 RepID=A0ABS7STD1_9BURK|nr:hypothetical protein [Massilia soli]MBZ2209189.1 hypothetical protein [Massilia soli]